jgi:hypothetical protein
MNCLNNDYTSNVITRRSVSYPSNFSTPFENEMKMYLIYDLTNQYVTFNGTTFNLTSDKRYATIFQVLNSPPIYNNNLGGIALQTVGGPNANYGYMRHAGYTCYSDNFPEYNYDFSWRFDNVNNLNSFKIYNYYSEPEKLFYLSAEFGFLSITSTSPPYLWRIEKIPNTSLSIYTTLRTYTDYLYTAFRNNLRIKILLVSTGQYVYYDGSYFSLTYDKNISSSFIIRNSTGVYNKQLGGVAMKLVTNSPIDIYINSAGTVQTFVANEIDLSWNFVSTSKNEYYIFGNGGFSDYLCVIGGVLAVSPSIQTKWNVALSFGL